MVRSALLSRGARGVTVCGGWLDRRWTGGTLRTSLSNNRIYVSYTRSSERTLSVKALYTRFIRVFIPRDFYIRVFLYTLYTAYTSLRAVRTSTFPRTACLTACHLSCAPNLALRSKFRDLAGITEIRNLAGINPTSMKPVHNDAASSASPMLAARAGDCACTGSSADQPRGLGWKHLPPTMM